MAGRVQPGDDVGGGLIRRKDRIEDVRHGAIVDHEGEALEEGHPGRAKRGKPHGARETQVFVREEREGEMEASCGFALVLGRLSREAEELIHAEPTQLVEMVAE